MTKITFHICVALERTIFLFAVCAILHQWMVTSKKHSTWHVSAFIYISSISIQQLFFRHEKWPQEYFHIPCGTILCKQSKTPWKILCFPSDHLRTMAPGICNIMGGKRCVTSFPRLTRFACCGSDIGYKSYCKNSAVIPISLLLHRFWNYAKLCQSASSLFLNVLFA